MLPRSLSIPGWAMRAGMVLVIWAGSCVVPFRPSTASAAATPTSRPPAAAWALRTIPIPPHLGYLSETDVALDGSLLAYSYVPPSKRRPTCQTNMELRLLNLTTGAVIVLDRLPTPTRGDCWGYNSLRFSYPWLVYQVGHSTPHDDVTDVIALNLRTRERQVVVQANPAAPHGAMNIVAQDLSGGTLALETIQYQGPRLSTSISLVDLASGRETVVVARPFAYPGDPGYQAVRGLSISGSRVVWTLVSPTRDDVMLYDGRTRRTVALTHDGMSLAARIYGETVAWIVSKTLIPEGRIAIHNLQSGQTQVMSDPLSYNIEIGDGLVSWTSSDDHTGAVPLYFLHRHALRYYLPTAAEQRQDAFIPAVFIFGREVLVPTLLHFRIVAELIAVDRVDIY